MTYAQKFGKFGIYTDGMLYKWFKDMDKALETWKNDFAEPECSKEWLEEYEDVQLIDMKTKSIICEL